MLASTSGFGFDQMGLICYIPVVVVLTVAGMWAVHAASHSAFAGIALGLAAIFPPGLLGIASLAAWRETGRVTKSDVHTLALVLSVPPLVLGGLAFYRVWKNRPRPE